MKTSTWLISILVCLVTFTGNAAAQCTRHFYNDSTVPFKVVMVYGVCNDLPVCTVNPGQSATLVYYGLVMGAITVSSSFYNGGFEVSACHIMHGGNTGYIAVNDPADGDVTTCGADGFDCPPTYCYGKFFNNSPVPFDVTLSTGSCDRKATCTVPPGGVGDLTYNGSVHHSVFTAHSSIFNASLGVSGCGVSSPNFARMRFNDPQQGDVMTCGGANFPCPAAPLRLKHSKRAVTR